MEPKQKLAALAVVLALWLPNKAQAHEFGSDPIDGDEQFECQSRATRVKGVAREADIPTRIDFNATGGQLDPNPILRTSILTFAERSCVVAHFSAELQIRDTFLFQVSIDGTPMKGHTRRLGFPEQPVVYESVPQITPPPRVIENDFRMASYSFIAEVERGEHLVEVRFANCCTGDPTPQPDPTTDQFLLSAVLTLEY